MWTRQELWAEHDAAHARHMRAQAIMLVVVLLTIWNVLALLAYMPPSSRHDPMRATPCSSRGPAPTTLAR